VLHGPTAPAAAVPATREAGPERPRERVLGRQAELAAIRATAVAARRAPASRVVWVAGEAGEGKSTLAEAAADQLTEDGWRAAWGRCPEVEGAPPGWAWQEVGEGLGFTTGAGSASPFLLARGIGAHLAVLAATSPVLVVIDDAHRADSLTLQLLRQVVDALAGAAVLFLITYRPSEVPAALIGSRAAVAARSGHLLLSGLGRGAVGELARSTGLAAGDDTIDVLAERTGGNPLFVRELARLLLARGTRAAHESVPEGVADVLRARMATWPRRSGRPACSAAGSPAGAARRADAAAPRSRHPSHWEPGRRPPPRGSVAGQGTPGSAPPREPILPGPHHRCSPPRPDLAPLRVVDGIVGRNTWTTLLRHWVLFSQPG
jgi:hypothetical protein